MKPEDPTSWIRSRAKSRQDARKASNVLRDGNEYVSEEIARLEAAEREEWAELQARDAYYSECVADELERMRQERLEDH